MQVILDGNRNFEFTREPEDVFAAVVELGEYLRQKGRAILSVRADNEEVPAEDLLRRLHGKAIADVGALEVTSEEIETLILTCLKELHDVLPELPNACRQLSAVFQSENPDDGFESFEKLAEIWQTIKARQIQLSSAMEIELETLEIDGVSIGQHSEELNEYLEEAAKAIEGQDYVLLGDLLEYELAPRAELESRIVGLLEEKRRNLSA